jgi:diguanylate cyclase (GGDEF)-like protein
MNENGSDKLPSRGAARTAHQRTMDAERSASGSDQTRSGADQTSSDADQIESDADQTASERDEADAARDQCASDRDQATSDDQQRGDADAATLDAYEASRIGREASRVSRLATHVSRATTTHFRLETAAERDATATARDETARRRDVRARALDRSLAASDAPVANKLEQVRARAVADRVGAAADRKRAARDRSDAAHERARLEAQLNSAHLDDLTGAFRREMGNLALTHEIDRARRGDGRFVIAFVDVDGMKRVNDRDGHASGDQVLRVLVSTLRSNLRSFDPVVRYGGDEFVCGLGGADLADVQHRFDVIGRSLEKDVGVRISVGFAALAPGESLDELTARADAALLDAKNARGE